MQIDPATTRLALRIAGTMISSLKTVLPGAWGELALVIGSNMITYSLMPPGAASKLDFRAILNAAASVIPSGFELHVMKSNPPPPPGVPASTVVIAPSKE